MSEAEVEDLASRVGLQVPPPLREYLLCIGLFQDLTHGGASNFEVFDTPQQFVQEREFLSEVLTPAQHDLFPFGGDGSGNVFAVSSSSKDGYPIYFVDHETGKVSRRKDFRSWLEGVVAKVLKGIHKRPPNARMTWCVQFSFSNTSFGDLLDMLSSVGRVKEVDGGWENPDTSPDGVTSSERRIELDDEMLKVTKLECADWPAPMIFFDMDEPVLKGIEHSNIRKLNSLFTQNCPDYKLVDYGPLDMSEENDA